MHIYICVHVYTFTYTLHSLPPRIGIITTCLARVIIEGAFMNTSELGLYKCYPNSEGAMNAPSGITLNDCSTPHELAITHRLLELG